MNGPCATIRNSSQCTGRQAETVRGCRIPMAEAWSRADQTTMTTLTVLARKRMRRSMQTGKRSFIVLVSFHSSLSPTSLTSHHLHHRTESATRRPSFRSNVMSISAIYMWHLSHFGECGLFTARLSLCSSFHLRSFVRIFVCPVQPRKVHSHPCASSNDMFSFT